MRSAAADSTQRGHSPRPAPSSAAVAQATRSFSSGKHRRKLRSGRREISQGLLKGRGKEEGEYWHLSREKIPALVVAQMMVPEAASKLFSSASFPISHLEQLPSLSWPLKEVSRPNEEC